MGKRTLLIIVFVTVFSRPVNLQLGPEADRNNEYFLDKHCNGPVFNIFDKEAVIKGHSSTDVQNSPLSCTLQLATENNFEKAIFRITVRSASIRNQDVHLAVYDGTPGQPLLASYDHLKGKGQSELFTTGNKVSFVLTRRDNRNYEYDLEFVVSPIVAGMNPGAENGWGTDYGYFNRSVPNMVIYIIVGVLFLIVIIIITIVGIVCYRKEKGLNKKPEEYKISYISQPPISRGPASEASSRNWVSTSRNSLRRERKPRRHSDDDSVFDGSVDSIPSKKRYDLDRSYENTNYNRTGRPGQHNTKPSYRNNSYVLADDDHPQKTYIQREMKPRVKSSRNYEPEEEEEEVGVGPDEEEEDIEDSVEEEQETEEEEEEQEEDEEDGEDEDAGNVLPPQSNSLPVHPPPRLDQHPLSGVPQPTPRHLPSHNQNPGYAADPRQMPISGPYGPRYVVYPGQQGPSFMPMVPGQFQPIQGQTVTRPPPPQYPAQQQPQNTYSVKANDPPIYSYLVQRGYNPVDGRESPVSVSTNASGRSDTRLIQPESSDVSGHNLDSGVEYMHR